MVYLDEIKAIVTDIEGTTTPIPFVKDVLFPYILKNLESFLEKEKDSEEFRTHLFSLRKQSLEDVKNKLPGVVPIPELNSEFSTLKKAIIENVTWQMKQDRKIAPLKNFQGFLWLKGYKTGELKSYCFPDVEVAFKRWTSSGVPIYIYSSGSIVAQKLLFEYTQTGNLLKYIRGHFDTSTAGSKLEVSSYHKIASEIGLKAEPSKILFLSDNLKELDAAKEAGFQIMALVRPQNYPIEETDLCQYPSQTSFENIL